MIRNSFSDHDDEDDGPSKAPDDAILDTEPTVAVGRVFAWGWCQRDGDYQNRQTWGAVKLIHIVRCLSINSIDQYACGFTFLILSSSNPRLR